MKYFLIFILLMFDVYGAGPIGEVIVIKGKATILRSGSLSSHEIKVGDKVLKDTRIMTYDKSMVKLKFIDQTVVDLGANSKIRIEEFNDNAPGVIDLITGRLRTCVKKSDAGTINKLYLKTHSAALMAEAADFQIIYNPANKNTALLTYKGEVEMIKLTESVMTTKQTVIKENRGTTASEVMVQENTLVLNTAEGLQIVMEAKKNSMVLVKAGQYSGALPGLSRPTIPVRISPQQLKILYQNESLDEKVAGEKVSIAPSSLPMIDQAAQSAPPEGLYNSESNEYAPRSGGFIDTKSGLYIAPSTESINDSGLIDSQTGQYVPPIGLRLDSQKGFLVLNDKTSEILTAQAESLNANLRSDLVFSKVQVPFNNKESTEIFKGQQIHFTYRLYSEKLDYNSDSIRGARSLFASKATEIKFDWEQKSSSDWKTHTLFAHKDLYFNDIGSEAGIQGSSSLVRMAAGLKYFISNSWRWNFDLGIDQNFFIDYESGNSNLIKVAMTKVSTGFVWSFFNFERWSSELGLGINIAPSKQTGALSVQSGVGTDLNLRLNYWFGKKIRAALALWSQNQSNTSSNSTGFEGESSRSQNGLDLGLQYHFN